MNTGFLGKMVCFGRTVKQVWFSGGSNRMLPSNSVNKCISGTSLALRFKIFVLRCLYRLGITF